MAPSLWFVVNFSARVLLPIVFMVWKIMLIPYHVTGEPYHWTRSTALSFTAELDGHVLGTLCAVTMALLTNRLDLCIHGLFGAGKSSQWPSHPCLLELDTTNSLNILYLQGNFRTRSFADLLLCLDPPSGAWAHRQACRRSRAQQEQLFPYQI